MSVDSVSRAIITTNTCGYIMYQITISPLQAYVNESITLQLLWGDSEGGGKGTIQIF